MRNFTYYSHQLTRIVTAGIIATTFIIMNPTKANAAAVCVTNPEQGLCTLTVTLTSSAYSVASGASVTSTFSLTPSILQYDVFIVDITFDATNAGGSWSIPWGTWPSYGHTRSGNTGALTSNTTIVVCVENSQGTIKCDSNIITVTTPPPGAASLLLSPSSGSASTVVTASFSASNATSYYYSADGGATTPLGAGPSATFRPSDFGWSSGSHSFRVQGCNAGGCGSWSASQIFTILTPTVNLNFSVLEKTKAMFSNIYSSWSPTL